VNLPLPCIICGQALESAVPDVVRNPSGNQPHGGTTFWTSGHYGSTVFDPQNSTWTLEINLCDPCLTAHAGRVLSVTTVRRTPLRKTEPWTPTDHEHPCPATCVEGVECCICHEREKAAGEG
jgi:hypothetical protein